MNLKKGLIIAIVVVVVIIIGSLVYFLLTTEKNTNDTNLTASQGVCSCTEDLDCSDFTTQEEAQLCFEYCGPEDVHRLDADKNGLACESLG